MGGLWENASNRPLWGAPDGQTSGAPSLWQPPANFTGLWMPPAPEPVLVEPEPEPPPPEPLPAILLGTNMTTGKPFGLSGPAELVGGLWILGKNGSGKTVTIERLAYADICAGRGCIVLDPAGDLIEWLIARMPDERLDDVVLLDAGDREAVFHLNPVWTPDPTDTYQLSNAAIQFREAVRKSTPGWGANLQIVIPNVAHLLMANPGSSLEDVDAVFADEVFRARLLGNVAHTPVRNWWRDTYNRATPAGKKTFATSTITRFQDFLSDANLLDILRGEQSIDFPAWLNQRKIVLIKLPTGETSEHVLALANDSRQLLGALLLQRIKAAAWRQVHTIPDEEDRPQVPFYVDEFPEFATPDFGDMFRKLRKSGIIPVIAHQDLAQLPNNLDAIPKAARHFFCFAATVDDAPLAAQAFNPEGQARNLPLSVRPLRDAPQRLRDGKVLELVHRLESLVETATVYEEIRLERRGARLRQSYWSHVLSDLENSANRYLFEVMQHSQSEEKAFWLLRFQATSAFSPSERDEYLEAIQALGDILENNPVYATGRDTVETDAQARTTLESRLKSFQVFEAYCRTDTFEQYVKMKPLPRANPTTPEARAKRQRIRANMLAQGILTPRRERNIPQKHEQNRVFSQDGDMSSMEPPEWEDVE